MTKLKQLFNHKYKFSEMKCWKYLHWPQVFCTSHTWLYIITCSHREYGVAPRLQAD